jgi:hypothetical protein
MLLQIGCTRVKKLKCNIDIENVKQKIKSETLADFVQIYTVRIKEEIYFPAIKCPVIEISNPTMEILDFKPLSTEHFQRLDNFAEISNRLKVEGKKFALQFINNCKMNSYNDFIIEFNKLDAKGEPCYRFICHYDELINPPKINYNINFESFKQKIIFETNADSIQVYEKSIKMGFSFPEIKCLVIEINNPSMEILDFKTLPIDKYQIFGDKFYEINEELMSEGYTIATYLATHYAVTDYDDIMLEFIKKDKFSDILYCFTHRYDKLLNLNRK